MGMCYKKDEDWVKKCMEYEVQGPRPRGRPKRTWREVVKEDCQARKLNKEDAMDRSKWIKLIKDVRWSGWVLVGQCFFWYRPTWVVPDQRPLNGCVCMYVTQQAKGTGTYRAAVSLSSVREVGPTIHFALPLLQVIVTSIQPTISYWGQYSHQPAIARVSYSKASPQCK